jgi:hypothetical protein
MPEPSAAAPGRGTASADAPSRQGDLVHRLIAKLLRQLPPASLAMIEIFLLAADGPQRSLSGAPLGPATNNWPQRVVQVRSIATSITTDCDCRSTTAESEITHRHRSEPAVPGSPRIAGYIRATGVTRPRSRTTPSGGPAGRNVPSRPDWPVTGAGPRLAHRGGALSLQPPHWPPRRTT